VGNRVIIAKKLKPNQIGKLHHDHAGASQMKSVAQTYFWYPVVDKDVKDRAHGRVACEAM